MINMPISLTSQRKRILAIGVAAGVIVLVVGLRLILQPAGPSVTPSPTPSPASPFERFLAFKVVHQNLDPIVVERERKVFEGTAQAMRQNPDFFEGWLTLASIKKQMGDFAGAAAIWEHAGTLRPLNSVSFNNLGDLYANFLPDYPKAVQNFRQAITNAAGEEKQQYYYVSLSELYRYRMSDTAQALAVLEEGMTEDPHSIVLRVKAAQLAAALGERAKAVRYYQAALKLSPDDSLLAEEYRKYRNQR